MRTIKIQDANIVVFDSIKELPIVRYNLFNQYAAQELGIGAKMEDVDKHFVKLDQFLNAGDIESARQERLNLHYNFYFVINGISIESRAFLCFIKSINGEDVENLEDDSVVDDLLRQLSEIGLTAGDVQDTLDELKKKLIMN